MHADSYIISYLFVVVFIISFNFFDGDSASPTAQLEWGLRIIYWRSVLELLTLNYENLNQKVSQAYGKNISFMLNENAFHTVNNLRLKLQAAETGPSTAKNYA